MKSMIVCKSIHHGNTEKVAFRIARSLKAEVTGPEDVDLDTLGTYDLVGFGSGIYGEKHHESLLDLADDLHPVAGKDAFIFSTSAIMGKGKVAKDHSFLREKLVSRGYIIVDEFSCKGFNTNSFLKFFGGMNKGRPNADDLRKAEDFAIKIKMNSMN